MLIKLKKHVCEFQHLVGLLSDPWVISSDLWVVVRCKSCVGFLFSFAPLATFSFRVRLLIIIFFAFLLVAIANK